MILLDHSSLDAVIADLNRYCLLDFCFRLRGTRSGKFGPPWKLFEVETAGQAVCLSVTRHLSGLFKSPPDHLPLNLKYICRPSSEFRLKDGAAVQIWAEPPPSSASVDGAQRRRLHENLQGMFA